MGSTDKPHLIQWVCHTLQLTQTPSEPDGLLIYHPYRFNSLGNKGYTRYLAHRENDDVPTHLILNRWDWLRYTYPSCWTRYIIFSPHYHFVGWINHLVPTGARELFIYKKKQGNILIIHLNRSHKMIIKKVDMIPAPYYPPSYTLEHPTITHYFPYIWMGEHPRDHQDTGDIIVIWEHKEKKQPSKKHRGKQNYIKVTLDILYKKYENVTARGWYTLPDFIALVEKNKKLTGEQKNNLMGILGIMGNKEVSTLPPQTILYTL